MTLLSSVLASEAEGLVVVVFSDSAESERLNSIYRKKHKPTDVLSFQGEEPGHLGDLLISIPVAQAQAKEYRTTITDELTRLIVHGTLHLIGYEHEKVPRAVATRMRRKEVGILRGLSRNRGK